jgi:uncharacterized protein YecT (DUF1311 family)
MRIRRHHRCVRRTLGALVSLVALGTAASGVAPASAATRNVAAGPGTTVAFVPIREAWDGNRVARVRDAAAACHADTSTLAIVTCDEDRAENADVLIDTVRSGDFAAVTTNAARIAINTDDRDWLANRAPVCEAGYPASGGGTIVEILVAACQRDVSAARLDAVKGVAAPTAQLQTTDDLDPDAAPYATTGAGTRIAAIDTQGDQTGGVVIAWIVIAGYRGFTVAPSSFTFVNGAYTDKGIVQGHPLGHHIRAGREYVFDIDYSRLGSDRSGTGRFEYRSGRHVVAAWK